ncbi:putative Holliday junction resolvase YggF [Mycoplasmopsis meleagridis]|uniref:Putative pre-16S rRNA nuclease n=1 Tax=Mycoplasmopsis meleagridis ATCC 25294 TaxID=1264554 RepID=A0A0F5H0K4_9BACT|nr:Holliday junction resolvase RuvX [Mycoplasmopsis meleagridis]KKB26851.1 putative Holliday junction resolvase [Mycoplasmopsis meleagridis ATCC 25294]KUH47397.1 Holliday junction resolvase [Mycoplasmopsis meleagridis]OAD18587.1 putative Holliday junction resolvase YggF [Mycoplasmopsis meleagridis]VEU77410.1 putative Holliday junction resolvase [Mycoplasmopsis meleagridis]
MRKIALDLGTKTCGLAISDSNNIISSSLKTIHFEENDFKKVIQELKILINEYSIDAFILGYPLRSNGNKSERTLMVENFSKLLCSNFEQKIYFVEEYGSTIKATKILKDAKLSAKKRKNIKDSLSAKIILQDFLDYGGKEIKWTI